MQKEFKEILDNTICFTHGGTLAGLYGILATQKISSNNALENHGDNTLKFTDPNKEFTQEDNFLFFESMADRGNLAYASLVDKNNIGFSFLLVADANTLLQQVDMLGSSDGMLKGRKDGLPLEVDIKKINAQILVPESYKEDVINFCHQLKQLGHNSPEHLLTFKPINELNALLSARAYTLEDKRLRQKEFCNSIGLNANNAHHEFIGSDKIVHTKTSTINVIVNENNLEAVPFAKKEFKTGDQLIEHMRQRPTLANLQRNSMTLFLEKNNSSVYKEISLLAQGRPPLLDIASNYEDLSFALNTLAHLHPFKEELNGEKRISSHEIRNIAARFKKQNTNVALGIVECLEEVARKNLSPEECKNIMQKHTTTLETTWFIAIDRVQQPPIQQSKIKQVVDSHTDKEILVWKEGMKTWENIKDMPELNLIKTSLNIANIRRKAFPDTSSTLMFKS